MVPCRGVDDGIRHGESVGPVHVGGQQGKPGIERHDHAFLRIGNHLICSFLANLPNQPFGKLQLNDGGNDALRLVRKLRGQAATQGACDKPFDPSGSIDHAHG